MLPDSESFTTGFAVKERTSAHTTVLFNNGSAFVSSLREVATVAVDLDEEQVDTEQSVSPFSHFLLLSACD